MAQTLTLTDDVLPAAEEPLLEALGPLRFRRWSWLPGTISGVVFGLLAVVLLGAAAEAARALPVGGNPALVTILTGLMLLSLAASVLAFCAATSRVLFFEHGLLRTSIFGSTSVRYDEVALLTYSAERQFLNTRYTGTEVSLAIEADDGRRISWRGAHQERRKGAFRHRYEGRDELDDVKALLSELIADRMMDAVLAGDSVPWTEQARLTATGLMVLRGRARGRVIDFEDLDAPVADGNTHLLSRRGDRWPVLAVRTDEPNFWPGLRLLERLQAAAALRPARIAA